MKLLIIDNTEPRHRDFIAPLVETVGAAADYEVVNYREIPPLTGIIGNFAGVIISGVPVRYRFSTLDKRLPYFNWLLEAELPVMGICLGHQLIGKLFGGTVIRKMETEHGAIAVDILQYDSLLAGLPISVAAHMMHRSSVTLPAGFELLGSTATCKNVIMRHADKPIYGLQFHPEYSKECVSLIPNFARLAELYQSSESEVDTATDVSLKPDNAWPAEVL